jgi:two-component system, NtrC family, response regulator HydG
MPEPSDKTTALYQRPALPAFGYRIRVISGSDAGASFEFDETFPGRVFVGTSPACSLTLTDRAISRRHFALEAEAAGLRIADVGSTNGTFIGGVRVFEALLTGGTRIDLGDTVVLVDAIPKNATTVSQKSTSFGKLLGKSPEMRRIYPLCERLAQSNVTLLVEGETGSGKEILAEAIHDRSPRAAGPFVVFDCTTVAPRLVESMLFGHERGSLSGAKEPHRGVFEQAHGGTLFIDEVGDLDIAVQPKLLRALEKGEVTSVGADRSQRFDVRVIAATRRDLDKEVQLGRFRDDLFFRLAVARIELPPLRKRDGDVAFLASEFFRELSGSSAATLPYPYLRKLEQHNWPGNVRELRNVIASRVALQEDIEEDDLVQIDVPEDVPLAGANEIDHILLQDLPYPVAKRRAAEHFERKYIERVLTLHGGNVARAAEASGIARRYFQIIKARRRTT